MASVSPVTPDGICWGEDGLVPAIAVDRRTGDVLMLAYMNREALEETLRTGRAVYFSRSRQALWRKGETSGNVQQVRELRVDCDADAILLLVDQHGTGACHVGEWSCFHRALAAEPPPEGSSPEGTLPGTAPAGARPQPSPDATILDEVRSVIASRHQHPRAGSYTSSLLEAGLDRVLKKVAEEAGEVMLAAKNVEQHRRAAAAAEPAPQADSPSFEALHGALAWEAADLLYHLLVALEWAGLPNEVVWQELERRRSGRTR